jgi:hypothetical protein
MTQQTTSLLRSIWEISTWRDDLLATFDQWVQDGASRSNVKSKLKALIMANLTKQAVSRLRNIDPEQVNWDQVTEFLCLCFYRRRLRRPLPEVPPDATWEKLSDAYTWGPLSLHPQQDKSIRDTVSVPLVPLEQKLLVHGGTRMVYRYEPDLAALLKRGEAFDGPVEVVSGESRSCHSNAAQLWSENKDVLVIVTGYALSDDGLWRQHSWLMRKPLTAGQHQIIETTIKRVKYFGFILNDTEAETFLRMNV